MTIRLRIAIITALALVIAVWITSFIVVNLMNRDLQEMTERRLIEDANYFSQMAEDCFRPINPQKADRIIDDTAKADGIIVHITDTHGRILIDTLHNHCGQMNQRAMEVMRTKRPIIGPIGDTTSAIIPVLKSDSGTLGAVILKARTDDINRAKNEATAVGIPAGMLTSLIGLALAYLFAATYMSPLTKLLDGIRKITAGQYESYVSPAPYPELREIGYALNDMATSVTRRIRNLEVLNAIAAQVTTSRRITDVASLLKKRVPSLLNAEPQLWIFDAIGENLKSVAIGGTGGRIIATPMCAVTRAVNERRMITIGTNSADYPSGTPVSNGLPRSNAAVIIPLVTQEGVIGAISMAGCEGCSTMTDEQIFLAVAVANLAAPAVASIIRTEINARSARMLQRILVPKAPPSIPRLDVSSRYQAAEEIGRMGGDYFDFIPISDKEWCFAIGDVSGKGLIAAQYTAMVKYVLRSYILEYVSPIRALERTNTALVAQMGDEMFITLFCCFIDLETGSFRYARAGHPAPVLYEDKTQTARLLDAAGPPAGIFDGATYDGCHDSIASGDVLVMFTDGIIEARRGVDQFGEDRLKACVEKYATLPTNEITDYIMEEVRMFAGGRLSDDAAIVVIKVK